MIDKPRFINEEFIRYFLNGLLDKCDKGQKKPAVTIVPDKFPELFDFNGADTKWLWDLIRTLESEYGIVSIALNKKRDFYDVDYKGARVRLITDKTQLLRFWLDRPEQDAELVDWNKSVQASSAYFADGGQTLMDHQHYFSGRSNAEIVKAFSSIVGVFEKGMTLRSLSAVCFWGDSKFLEKKPVLFEALFPEIANIIAPRPLLICAYLPENFEQFLFVENQDSFLLLASKKPSRTALIYSAGYKGSALRVKDQGAVQFSFLNGNVSTKSLDEFHLCWFLSANSIPCYFWGDLDFSGLGILAAMRNNSFSNMKAWQPGFSPMLKLLEQGKGHSFKQAGKEKQVDPVMTGCDYADSLLLTTIRAKNMFVDQESVVPEIDDL